MTSWQYCENDSLYYDFDMDVHQALERASTHKYGLQLLLLVFDANVLL